MTDERVKTGFRETMSLLGYGLKLIWKMAPAYLPLMLINAFIKAAQPLTVLFLSARILNELAGARDVRAIMIYAASVVAASFILSAIKALLTREIETTANWERLFNKIQLMEAERFTQMDFVHIEDAKISEILARMDTQARGNGLGITNMFRFPPIVAENLFSLVISIFLLTGGLSVGVAISGWLAAVLYGVFAVGLLITVRYRTKEKLMLEDIYRVNEKANTSASYYGEYITEEQAAKDVRIYDQGEALGKLFRESFVSKSWMPFFFLEGRMGGFGLALLSVVGGGFYLLMGLSALGGAATVGGIVQSVGAATAMAAAAGTLVSTCGQLYNNGAFLRPMRDFMTLPDVLIKGTKPVPGPEKHGYRFEFRNVSFRYPGTEKYALKNLDLRLNAGQRIAVVGPNGSGKTTMIKLLCRLYDPTEGEILLDGVNIKEYDYGQYIALFSVVFQDFALFPIWLGQNVAVREDYNAGRVKACLEGAGFSERLSSMAEGLDTILYKTFDEGGTQVSGGEAQKIALARALYKDAPVVVLDEPTAALDPIAEYEVYSTFDKTIGDKMAVFISHRLSSCRFCHDIAVFDNGSLVQRGDHGSLLGNKNGLYYELWNAQAQHYTDQC